MPKRNYGFEKRQKELNKQRKRDEKLQKKLARSTDREERDAPAEPDAGLERGADA